MTDLEAPCYEFPEIPRWTLPLPHRVLGLLIGGCFLLFGLTGNILLVTSYIKNKHVQTPFNTIVLSMSFNDLVWITCIFTVLLSVYGRGEWLPIYTPSGDVDVLCAYMNIIHTQCQISSFLHVLVVGLYRYAVVVHPIGKLGRISQSPVWVSLMIFIVYAFVCVCLEHTACKCAYSCRQIIRYRTEIYRTPISGVKGSGANHYPRAPAHTGSTVKWWDDYIVKLIQDMPSRHKSWYTCWVNVCPPSTTLGQH